MPKALVLANIETALPHQTNRQPVATFFVVDLPNLADLTPAGTIDLDPDDAAAFLHLLEKHDAKPLAAAAVKNPLAKIKEKR